MTITPSERLTAAMAELSNAARLYDMTVLGCKAALLVEAFAAHDALDTVGTRDVIVLSTSIHLELDAFLGQAATFDICLADGSRTRFAGEISEAAMLGSDGGMARYRLRIASWLWRLAHGRHNRVWQDKSVVAIVDAVFQAYRPAARWRWSDEMRAFMDGVPPRSYCCQYRESDLDFVRRLLASEGICWRVEQDDGESCVFLFGDSRRPAAVPEDMLNKREGAVRYHAVGAVGAVGAVECQDTLQSLVARRSLHVALTTLLSTNDKARQVVAGSSPSTTRTGRLPALESFDAPGQDAFPSRALAQRHADLHMEAQEARGQLWRGRSTVRTLRAGTCMTLAGVPLPSLGNAAAFTVLRVMSVGVNNLSMVARQALEASFGPVATLVASALPAGLPEDAAQIMAQAQDTGYANCFEAVPADVVWRPVHAGNPTASGSQSAIVVGADGSEWPHGADELYCDRLGRVRIRFHWQEDGAACWVRVAQRAAGGGMGSQFLPRIGQEVLVQFLENDIDRPIIVGALYNGRGEGDIPATPGGRVEAPADHSVFRPAHDHARSGQGNRAGGNSPVWHGASGDSDGHRNLAAQWGLRSKEFGGAGYNQLLFDDTDGQGRVQLKCTQAATELNLGHLTHAADNYRGSSRGLGVELRTDAYGAVRAGKGLLVSSHGIGHSAAVRDPAGQNAAGIALLQQASRLTATLHSAALMQQTVGLVSAPLDAMAAALAATVDKSGAMAENPAPDDGQLPHSGAPIITMVGRDGCGASAGQSLQLANGEAALVASGQDSQFFSGGQLRLHAGQAIGVLGGAIDDGQGRVGLQLIAAKELVDVQAQANALKVQAQDEIDVISAHAHIDWAAAKRITLSTAGGANITIEAGNIMVQCPGKITVHAGNKRFTDPEKLGFDMPALPRSICVACLKKSLAAGPAFTMAE
jgi:type VI secretion system secreted protein VgrG